MDIESLNSELRTKLGTKPLYGWKRGSDLFVMMPEFDEAGQLQYETGAIPGSLLIGTKVKHRKVFYQDLYEKVRPGIQLGARWVLCRLYVADMGPDDWNRAFGGRIPWVKEAWVPVDWSGGRAVGGHLMSDPYQPITSELQARAIGTIRMNQQAREKITARQMLEAAYDDREKREARIQRMGEWAAEQAPVGGWCRQPGEKSDLAIFSGKSKETIQ
jgi:hypothetical protein